MLSSRSNTCLKTEEKTELTEIRQGYDLGPNTMSLDFLHFMDHLLLGQLLHCSGDASVTKSCNLPLGTGSLTFEGMSFPIAPGSVPVARQSSHAFFTSDNGVCFHSSTPSWIASIATSWPSKARWVRLSQSFYLHPLRCT